MYPYILAIFVPLVLIGLVHAVSYRNRRRKSQSGSPPGRRLLTIVLLALGYLVYFYFTVYWLFAMLWMDWPSFGVLCAIGLVVFLAVRRRWRRQVFLRWHLLTWTVPLGLMLWTVYFQFGKPFPPAPSLPGVTPLIRFDKDAWQPSILPYLGGNTVNMKAASQQPRAIFSSGLPNRYYLVTGSETDGFSHLLIRYNLETRALELVKEIPGCIYRGACDPIKKQCYFAMIKPVQNNNGRKELAREIAVFDELNQKFLAPIPVSNHPRVIDLDTERRQAYVGLVTGRKFFISLDLDTNQITPRESLDYNFVAGAPCFLLTNPSSGRTYLTTDQLFSPIFVYDPATDELQARKPPFYAQLLFGYGVTLGLGATADDSSLYVAYPFSGLVVHYRLPELRVESVRFLEPGVREVVVPAETSCFFVGGFNLGNLYVLDKQTMAVRQRTHVGFRLRQFQFLPELKSVLIGDSSGYSLVDVAAACY